MVFSEVISKADRHGEEHVNRLASFFSDDMACRS